jgi:hypothetical protein
VVGDEITDEELTALALAADPDAPLAKDAVPIGVHLARVAVALPQWYMPPVTATSGSQRWRLPVVLTIISAFLFIEVLGLCNTYGQLVFA